MVADDARLRGVAVERMLVALNREWAALDDARRLPVLDARELLNRLVTLSIREFYPSGRAAAAAGRRSTWRRAMRAQRPEESGISGDDGAAGSSDGTVAGTGDADARFACHVAELRTRLRWVCREWREPEFEALLHRIALTKVRWDDAPP